MKDQLMLDIETLDTKPSSVILSIGAVQFDLETGELGERFHIKIDIQSNLDVGRTISASTFEFWMKQDEEARLALFKDTHPLKVALEFFSEFIEAIEAETGKKLSLWGNSARFDMGIVSDAYDSMGWEIPWNHWKEKDVRTLVAFNPSIKKNMVFGGVKHDALDDCKHQIKYCVETWKSLKK